MLLTSEYHFSDACYPKNVTVYRESDSAVTARLLYFHGGGLVYGSRIDLPKGHIEAFTQAGYEILSFDYPLAPAAGLELILDDVCASVNSSCKADCEYSDGSLPYFLWGRSAGAYLILIAAASQKLERVPSGILSWYGYGFLCDNWFCTPSAYYSTLPSVDASCLDLASHTPLAQGSLDTHYSIYVYARQTGYWQRLLYNGREKFFYLNYSLRACSQLPCPIFAAHCTGDTDVPFEEFTELCNRFHALRFIAAGDVHDFDRDPENPFTAQLLKASLAFLRQH